MYELGPDGGDNETDGELIAETEEVAYECGARYAFFLCKATTHSTYICIYYSLTEGIHPIHVTAMMNKKRGLEGKSARQYVHRDVTSLLLHVPVT